MEVLDSPEFKEAIEMDEGVLPFVLLPTETVLCRNENRVGKGEETLRSVPPVYFFTFVCTHF